MTVEKIISILLSFTILLQAWAIRRYTGTWIFPGAIMSSFWFLYTAVPLMLLIKQPINVGSVLYILLACFFFSLSSIVFDWQCAFKINSTFRRKKLDSDKFLKFVFYLLATSALVLVCVDGLQRGFIPSLSALDLLDTSNQLLADRYEAGGSISDLAGKVAILFMYTASSLGGLLMGPKSRRIIFTPIFAGQCSATLLIIVDGNKGVAVTVCLFGAAFYGEIAFGERKILDGKLLGELFFFGCFAAAALTFGFLARGVDLSSGVPAVIDSVLGYFTSYALSHLYAFSDWFSFFITGDSVMEYEQAQSTLGFYTLMSIFQLMGDSTEVVHGIYAEYYSAAGMRPGNIYTIFRGLISDFGLIGSLVYMFVVGLVVHLSFYLLLVSVRPYAHVAFFVYSVGFIYTSFIVSLLTWDSPHVSSLLMYLLLCLSALSFTDHNTGHCRHE